MYGPWISPCVLQCGCSVAVDTPLSHSWFSLRLSSPWVFQWYWAGLTPTKDPESWPTCRNVTLAVEKITCEAKRGDFVYIHYSGHGTRIRASIPFAFSNTSTGDLALVLLGGERGERVNCLKGRTLAGLLNTMVNNGLLEACSMILYVKTTAHSLQQLLEARHWIQGGHWFIAFRLRIRRAQSPPRWVPPGGKRTCRPSECVWGNRKDFGFACWDKIGWRMVRYEFKVWFWIHHHSLLCWHEMRGTGVWLYTLQMGCRLAVG